MEFNGDTSVTNIDPLKLKCIPQTMASSFLLQPVALTFEKLKRRNCMYSFVTFYFPWSVTKIEKGTQSPSSSMIPNRPLPKLCTKTGVSVLSRNAGNYNDRASGTILCKRIDLLLFSADTLFTGLMIILNTNLNR